MTAVHADFKKHMKDMANLNKISRLLTWDREVMMPPDSIAERAQTMATISAMQHGMATDPRLEKWFDIVEAESNTAAEKRNLLLLRENYKLAGALPERLVRELSESVNKCVAAWRHAKQNSDWKSVEPFLENLFALSYERAQIYADLLGKTTYDANLYLFARGNNTRLIDGMFDQLRVELPPLLERTLEACKSRTYKTPSLPIEAQEKLSRQMAEAVGYSFRRGRLDASTHPFSRGTKYDSRMTTRYLADKPLAAIRVTMHETGHALYSQNVPDEWEDMPVGQATDLSLHESQSLLLERHVGLSPQFLSYLHGVMKQDGYASDCGAQDLVSTLHHVERDYIRVEANEISYPLHVMLRYEMEKKLFARELKVSDIPDAWNAQTKALLGLDVPEHRLGCMQDIHWFQGSFGYFPTYTQGALYAAQIFTAIRKDIPDLMDQIGQGEFKPLMTWLNRNIHNQGMLYDAADLITKVTGEPPSSRFFLDHLKERYLGK
jgi:carboxypeptidase Taq